MKTPAQHLSFFDAVSTFVVMAVLGSVLLIGLSQSASAVSPESFSAQLLTLNDRPNDVSKNANIREAILTIINYLLTFVGIIAVALIIWAGFLMMTAAGNEDQIGSAKQTIIWALVGIVVILLSWVIVQFVANIFA